MRIRALKLKPRDGRRSLLRSVGHHFFEHNGRTLSIRVRNSVSDGVENHSGASVYFAAALGASFLSNAAWNEPADRFSTCAKTVIVPKRIDAFKQSIIEKHVHHLFVALHFRLKTV
jgi:hypothetical protein